MRLVDTRAYVGMLKELVEQGKEVRMVISGSSMAPFLIHGRDSIFFRAPERELRKGDIVFYERPGGQFVVHRICGVHGESYDLIGDGQTEIEHNVRREQIFARVTQVERKGKRLAPGSFWWGFFEKVWIRMIPLRPMGNRIYRLLQGKDPHTGKTKGKKHDYRNRNRIPCGGSCVFDGRKSSSRRTCGADRKTMESSVCPRGTAFAAVSGLRCCGKNTGICRASG